ncbi:MAG: type II toxin-antitoxin system VapC family toxin [Bacteroidia bacterium]
MIHIFIDTNVLIDFLADRKPFAMDAAKLFDFALKNKITIYVAAVSFNNIYYILRQMFTHTKTIKIIAELEELTNIVDVTKETIKKSIHSEFKDFEDAIQYHCAKSVNKIECIVTRNTKDFKNSTLPIFNPKEALSLIENRI